MEEPSVLDYVKSKLTFWKPSSIDLPDSAYDQEAEEGSTAESGEAARVSLAPARFAYRFSAAGLVLTSGALVLALFAQAFLEPPSRAAELSAFIYLLAAVVIGFAYFRGYVKPSDLPLGSSTPIDLAYIRFESFVIGMILLLLAFVLFGRGTQFVPEFNVFNTLAWIASIVFLVWAFRVPGWISGLPSIRQRVRLFVSAPAWRITVTRWGLLLLFAVGLVLFFRFYRLDTVPAEMVSDHAEKLLDVSDVLNGELRVFFPRNTGREAFQFYWTALMVKLFDTGLSFMALKLGTVLGGLLTLLYIYRIGLQIGNRWVALYALLFAGFSYWANIQSRIGLRFPLYPMFLAPMLYYLIRGLRTANRNDFLWAGLWLGIGLHGYTSFRIVPFLVIAAVAIYFLHHLRNPELRRLALIALVLVGLISLAVFVPLLRFTIDQPDLVALRSLTRLSGAERPLPGPAGEIFLQNTWNALTMFFWSNGDVWVHSIPYRPALDLISAALFFLGLVLVALRYLRQRQWIDLFLLVSIPILLLPSILSLAFPNENPNLNRTTGAYIVVFLILAIGFDALLRGIRRALPGHVGSAAALGTGLVLVFSAALNNYDLVFNQYDQIMRQSAWNSSEMGAVIRNFDQTIGQASDAWVVAYPYWVDTRLVGINAGFPRRDTAINYDQIQETQRITRAKLFILNMQDVEGIETLRALYPDGRFSEYRSFTPGKDFLIFLVPAQENILDGVSFRNSEAKAYAAWTANDG
jgi:hypothetical protein